MNYLFSSKLSSGLIFLVVIALQLFFSAESFGQVATPGASVIAPSPPGANKEVVILNAVARADLLNKQLTAVLTALGKKCGAVNKSEGVRFTLNQLVDIALTTATQPVLACSSYLSTRSI